MNLAALRTTALMYLGTAADDPAYPSTTLNLLAQQAYSQVLAEMMDCNPGYLSTTVTLTPDSSTALTYTFSTQSPPITNYHKWLEVRWDTQTGGLLIEVRPEQLDRWAQQCFALTGPDDTPVITLGQGSGTGHNLFFRYAYWPAALAVDTDVPVGVPSQYHDVLAFRMAQLGAGLGAEGAMTPAMTVLAQDRLASLLATVSRRGVQPSRTRGFGTDGGWNSYSGWSGVT